MRQGATIVSMSGLAMVVAALAVVQASVGAPALPSQVAVPPTALPLQLTGILFDQAQPARSACLIRCVAQPGRQGIFLVGERACDVAEVREVLKDAVVVEDLETKRLERLTFPSSAPRALAPPRVADPVQDAAPAPEPIQVALPREAVQAAVANLPELLSSAVAVPRFRQSEGGQQVIDGFVVTQVKPSGTAERLGLRSGDVILDVNGQVLDGMPTVMRLFSQLQATPQVTITVLRDGQRMSVVFNTK